MKLLFSPYPFYGSTGTVVWSCLFTAEWGRKKWFHWESKISLTSLLVKEQVPQNTTRVHCLLKLRASTKTTNRNTGSGTLHENLHFMLNLFFYPTATLFKTPDNAGFFKHHRRDVQNTLTAEQTAEETWKSSKLDTNVTDSYTWGRRARTPDLRYKLLQIWHAYVVLCKKIQTGGADTANSDLWPGWTC